MKKIESFNSLVHILGGLSPGDEVHYTTVSGKKDKLIFSSRFDGLVQLYRNSSEYSQASYFTTDAGDYLRIPDLAFRNVFNSGVYIKCKQTH